jgi:hypothetical protein
MFRNNGCSRNNEAILKWNNDNHILNRLPCHTHWNTAQSESCMGGCSSQSVRYAIHSCQTFLHLQNACVISFDCTAQTPTLQLRFQLYEQNTMTRWFIICHKPFFTPLFYPLMKCIERMSFPLIKLSSKTMSWFFNWTHFNKQLQRTHV